MARWGILDLQVWKTILSSVAPSTKLAYEKVFWNFVSFFDEKDLSFDSIEIDTVLSFLQRFVGLSESRIRTVVAALKFFLRVYKRADLSDHPLLSLFAKGAQNLAPLPREKPSIWNPETVLKELKSRPRPSSFLPCAREALLLLLLATGWRVDDAWKLDVKVNFTSESMIVFFRDKRKCKVKGTHTLSREIPAFSESERVCPVRALSSFVNLARKIRKKDSHYLFVSSLGLRASKDTLRRWVEVLLLSCGISASAGSCRSAASSSALERKWPLDQILKSAGWSSESTFRKYYDRKVRPVDAPLNLLESQ
jgi:integrase